MYNDVVYILTLRNRMLAVRIDEVQVVYESQPLLAPLVEFPPPGGFSDDNEDNDDAPRV